MQVLYFPLTQSHIGVAGIVLASHRHIGHRDALVVRHEAQCREDDEASKEARPSVDDRHQEGVTARRSVYKMRPCLWRV
ncbi:hypothetical protein DPMN_185439 [Dreissena polymorpha]|uniref:Uncharacterized protein n=1 Tax=Dreissena polymorpha TaxID=45954 RepID=A0A9D4DLE9_DREPO|nr:hypothetical protein DPMN_185439 [Dreissena polymorpha]